MDLILLLMEEMEKLMELMKEALPKRHSAFSLREHQQQHRHHKHPVETLQCVSGAMNWSQLQSIKLYMVPH
jgi:hypothetical protein